MKKVYDVLIVGAGPAGMSAALYSARFGLCVALVEKSTPGGLLLRTNRIENYLGFPQGVKGYELSDALVAQLEGYPIDRFSGQVRSIIDSDTSHKFVHLDDESIEAKTIVICSGGEYRRLGVPREEELLGKGISYCALCDGNFFHGLKVAIVGGGNTALQEALHMSKIASDVFLIHRRHAFRGSPIEQERVNASDNIHIIYDSVITALQGKDFLEGVVIKNLSSKQDRVLDVAGLFVFIGYEPAGSFFPATLKLDTQGFIITDAEMQTSIPGMFAAGDIRSKACRQIATAVGDGVTAANSAYLYLGL